MELAIKLLEIFFEVMFISIVLHFAITKPIKDELKKTNEKLDKLIEQNHNKPE